MIAEPIEYYRAGCSHMVTNFLRNDTVNSQTKNETLNGTASNDSLVGGTGDDFLSGKNGDDTLDGGAGNDRIFGGAGDDFLIGYHPIPDPIAEYGRPFLQSDDLLDGGTGSDTLRGGPGNDTLIGGAGHDILRGDDGSDRFTFTNLDNSIDTITDFIWQQKDQIVVSASGFGGGLIPGPLERDLFYNGPGARDKNDRFIFDPATKGLFFDIDGNGPIPQQQFAIVQSHDNWLMHEDFSIIA